ncbi:MAG: lipid-A-disaccharide synthase [Pontibacterium sp.]
MSAPLKIGIVAGEASGDILGAGLIKALKTQHPDLDVVGIGGELMQAEGCRSLFPMERLSVMGLVEVLGRLRELLGIRKQLADFFLNDPPDVFIGIDAPDFTLGLEGRLKEAGIATVHYVSPSVWAWRRKRVHKIKRTTDLMLTLFPFEARFYEENQQAVRFVGHPLATMISGNEDSLQARQALSLSTGSKTLIALLPGSRGGELKYLAEPFLDTARWLTQHLGQVSFVLPAVNEKRYEQLQALIDKQYADLDIQLLLKHSREAMAASDVILIASGTATLEATLLKKPMVVAYKMAPLTYSILSRLVKSPYISLPNLLAGEKLVPEVLQNEVRAEVLGAEVLKALEDQQHRHYMAKRFNEIHDSLALDANKKAAAAVLDLVAERN